MKHRLKLLARELYARLLFHTGLWRLVDRSMPRRLVILFGHCVDAPEVNDGLPADMKIAPEALERILRFVQRAFDVRTVGAAAHELLSGESGRSLVALSMDDGYRDNATHLLPLLEPLGVPATIFLETRPLDSRRVNWSHKYFWLLGLLDVREIAQRYHDLSQDERAREALRALLAVPGSARFEYASKRILKYDADPSDRERVVDALFREHGGDERALCDRIFMTWDDARRLRDAGWELGCHTVSHPILSRLGPTEAAGEIEDAACSMERELGDRGRTFAYPFGRRWDYDAATSAAVREAGYAFAVMTHAGVNHEDADPWQLRRVAIDDHTRLHLLAAEVSGGFELLRRCGGPDLSE